MTLLICLKGTAPLLYCFYMALHLLWHYSLLPYSPIPGSSWGPGVSMPPPAWLLWRCGAAGGAGSYRVHWLHCTVIHWTALLCTALHCPILPCNALHGSALLELGIRTGGQGQNTIQGALHTLMLCTVYSKVFRANKVVCNTVEYSALQCCPVQFLQMKCHIIEQLGTFHFSREREQESREQTVIGRFKSANSYFTQTTLHCTALLSNGQLL